MKKDHLSTDKPAKNKEDKLDKTLADSFPTSDPPSFSPGSTGEPKEHENKQTKTPKSASRPHGAPGQE